MAGIVLVIRKQFAETALFSENELDGKLSKTTPLIDEMWLRCATPVVNFWHESARPVLLKEAEKMAAKIRIIVLRLERQLHDLTNYIRGKREMGETGGSAYWEEVKKAGNKEIK